ncbi:MAG TPA: hypothetical protein VFW69_23900 [Mycobacterium sp.]|nr:hypothetical protein [Mycobacterium sp.]
MADITIREARSIEFADVAAMHYPVWRQSWSGVLPDQVLDAPTSPKTWAVLVHPRDLTREKNDFHLDGRTMEGAGDRREGAPFGLPAQASMTTRSPAARETHTSMPSSPGAARPR